MKPLYSEYFQVAPNGDVSLQVPQSFNFAYDVVDRIGREEPDKLALVWSQDVSCTLYAVTDVHERSFTFAQMSQLSNQTANMLREKGIGKGDRVLLLMKRHYSYWFILLALHKLGAVAMPAPCLLNHEELVHRMNRTHTAAVVCLGEEKLCDKVRQAASESPSVQNLFCVGADQPDFVRLETAIESFSDKMERIPTAKEDPLLLYFTSGTTGNSKIVIQDGMYPLGHIPTALLWQNVRDGGLHLSVADTGWAKASWGKIYGQWLCGSAIMAYDYDVFSAVRMMNVITANKVTTFCAPPTIYRFLVKNNLLNGGFGPVEYAATAGEALNAEIINAFKKLTGLEIHAGYGQTESTMLVGEMIGDEIRPGSMGRPNPLYRPFIVDEEGNLTADNEPGEIVISGKDNCTVGLCVPPPEGEDCGGTVWDGDLYRTGDIAYRDADGYYWFVGRVDDVIKSSGYRISPFEVESVLIQHPAVMECAVTGAPDKDRGFSVKATVVLREGYQPDRAMTNELRDFVRQKTADYKVPRTVDYVAALPKTFSGKVRHVEIRNADKNKSQS